VAEGDICLHARSAVDIYCTKGFFRDRGKEVTVRVGGGKFGMFYCGFLQEDDEAVGIGSKGMES
jgi:hypothetical protein